jgi:hypothetical protein
MKDVAACDKLRWGGKQPLTRRSPNGETYPGVARMTSVQTEVEHPANWNILVAGGKEKNPANGGSHSLSSGERKGNSLNFLNRTYLVGLRVDWVSRRIQIHMFNKGCKSKSPNVWKIWAELQRLIVNRIELENSARASDSLVDENY